jgi:hypothetical protein
MFQQHLALALSATRAAVEARANLPDRWSFRKTWGRETQEERAAYYAACRAVNRAKGAAYAARLRAAVLAVQEGVPLTFSEGQEGGIFHLPYPSTTTRWVARPVVPYTTGYSAVYKLDNGVSARGVFRQVKGWCPSWQELETFVQEVCAPRTPHREGRALRGCPILRDLADG